MLRIARFISRHVNWKLDPVLLRLTGGRFATTLVFPSALLETTGARTGQRRKNVTIYFHDPLDVRGETVVIVPSNAGADHHPAWFHNLLAHPDVVLGGEPMRASVVDDEGEHARLWPLAENVYPAYGPFRRDAAKAGRTVPLVRLTPR